MGKGFYTAIQSTIHRCVQRLEPSVALLISGVGGFKSSFFSYF